MGSVHKKRETVTCLGRPVSDKMLCAATVETTVQVLQSSTIAAMSSFSLCISLSHAYGHSCGSHFRCDVERTLTLVLHRQVNWTSLANKGKDLGAECWLLTLPLHSGCCEQKLITHSSLPFVEVVSQNMFDTQRIY